MLPSQMRNITGGSTGYGPDVIGDNPYTPGGGGGGGGGSIGGGYVPPGVFAATTSQCCFNPDSCEDYECTTDADCAAGVFPGTTCKIISTK